MPPSGPITIDSPAPLKADTLFFRSMSGVESLSRCFEFEVLVSSSAELKPADLLGVPISVHLQTTGSGPPRHFNGLIAAIDFLGANEVVNYRLVLRPWFWLLTASADCRIFQNMGVVDIIKKVFSDLHFSDFDVSGLTMTYKPRDYTVQYRETNFDFVSRLMEREGIYYYFKHEASKHTLMLVDDFTSHEAPPGGDLKVPYRAPDSNRASLMEHLQSWQLENAVETGVVTLADYDFTKSRAKLTGSHSGALGFAHDGLEVYDYPGGFDTSGAGDAYAIVRLQERQTPWKVAHAQSNARRLAVGSLFSLIDYPIDAQNKDYLVTTATYTLRGHQAESTVDPAEPFECAIGAIESTAQFRPPTTIRRPFARGPQTAIVVGPGGEEIWTDNYGRVKVQFHWDRQGKNDEKSSCWIRVAQLWAGPNWGGIHIPRIGQEVIVDFLEGDPDRPIITGRVYNDANMPPYALPANKTQSGIKSRSSKGGNQTNANEIRFEDLKGSEEFFHQSEKNMTGIIKNNETRSVGVDRTTSIGSNETLTVGKNRSATIDVDDAIKVKGNRTLDVTKNETTTVGGDRSVSTQGNETITVQKNQATTVTGNQSNKVTGNQDETVTGSASLKIAGSRTQLVAGTETIVIGQAQSLTTADQTVTVASRQVTVAKGDSLQTGGDAAMNVGGGRSASVGKDDSNQIGGSYILTVAKDGTLKIGKQLTLDGGDEVKIQSGDASISLKKNGDIEIKGKDITINGSGNVTIKGSKIAQN